MPVNGIVFISVGTFNPDRTFDTRDLYTEAFTYNPASDDSNVGLFRDRCSDRVYRVSGLEFFARSGRFAA
jgi:hypothetical protein